MNDYRFLAQTGIYDAEAARSLWADHWRGQKIQHPLDLKTVAAALEDGEIFCPDKQLIAALAWDVADEWQRQHAADIHRIRFYKAWAIGLMPFVLGLLAWASGLVR